MNEQKSLLEQLKSDIIYKETSGIKNFNKGKGQKWIKIHLSLQGTYLVFKNQRIDVSQVEKVQDRGKSVVIDKKMYYIFEVKIGNKKEKFGTELPQDVERWIKVIEPIMLKPNVVNNQTGVKDGKICLDPNEWKSKGNTFPNMVDGEEVLAIFPDTCFEINYLRKKVEGVDCIITNYRVYVLKTDSELYDTNPSHILIKCTKFSKFIVPIFSIMKVDISNNRVEVSCRDGRRVGFRWENQSNLSLFQYYVLLHRYVEPKESFAYSLCHSLFNTSNTFDHKSILQKSVTNEYGYIFYHPNTELTRMGVPNEAWKVSTLNSDYSLSATYPKIIAYPSLFDEKNLEELATFRTKNRLPALSWVHPKVKSGLVRCSQPKRGMKGLTNEVDKHYIRILSTIGSSATSTLVVYDARSKVAAMGNRGIGGGFEDYSSTRIFFLEIENIHEVRNSWNALMKLCQDKYSGDDFPLKVHETGWHKLISKVMEGAYQVAATIDAGESVLTHCSDGWDRTAQLTSIAMIMLDPYYRTFDGFLCLIEKEWMSFGHQFHLRLGYSTDFQNESPVFFQFLECVYHLLKYFPVLFEFSEQLLVAIVDQLYNGCFGTFMYNTEAARVTDNEYEKTISLWAYIMMKRESFLNPCFVPTDGCELMKIEPRHITIWESVFQRWDPIVMNAVNFQKNMKAMLMEKQKDESKFSVHPKSPRLAESKRTMAGMRHVQSSPSLNQEELPEITKIKSNRGESRQKMQEPLSPKPSSASNLTNSTSNSPRSTKPQPPIPLKCSSLSLNTDAPRKLEDSASSLSSSNKRENNNNNNVLKNSGDNEEMLMERKSVPIFPSKEEKGNVQKKQRETVQ